MTLPTDIYAKLTFFFKSIFLESVLEGEDSRENKKNFCGVFTPQVFEKNVAEKKIKKNFFSHRFPSQSAFLEELAISKI